MIIIFFIFFIILIWIIINNFRLSISYYQIETKKIKEKTKIALISDIHDSKLTKKIIEKLSIEQPDFIVIAGDLTDKKQKEMCEFVKHLSEIAPTIYVAGNHESSLKNYNILLKEIESSGAILLTQNQKKFTDITFYGIEDPIKIKTEIALNNFITDSNFDILVAHHPEKLNLYAQKGFDLILSGHAHGGQIIIPFLGGLYSPNQGKFPEYYKGKYTKNKTTLIVSAGVGGPKPRINNPPEICIIKIMPK